MRQTSGERKLLLEHRGAEAEENLPYPRQQPSGLCGRTVASKARDVGMSTDSIGGPLVKYMIVQPLCCTPETNTK